MTEEESSERTIPPSRRGHQKPLVKSAKRAGLVGQMHFQDPVLGLPLGIRITHASLVFRTDPIVIPIARQPRVRKFTDDVPGDFAGKPPTRGFRQSACDIV